MSNGAIYVARNTFLIGRRVIVKGTTVREGHELLKEYGELFDPQVVDYEYEAPKPPPPPAKKAVPPPPPRSKPEGE
ncbi:hypothetical protein [Streptomyces microflavus]|uniref:hypothetical protein n=1 Tax=Streptomyces microflavus TaxID=1919 RepID=UPI003691578D